MASETGAEAISTAGLSESKESWHERIPSLIHHVLFPPHYLFVHIPKNGGMTIRKAPNLQTRVMRRHPAFIGGRRYIDAMERAMREAGFTGKNIREEIGHARWRDYNPDLTRRLQALAIVRNPWSRVVSRYTFMLKEQKRRGEDSSAGPQSFEAFLELRHIYGGKDYFWHRAIHGWFNQLDYVTDDAGAIRADLLRTEHLSEESSTYFGLEQELGVRKKSATGDYRGFYNPQTIQIVADWYKRDIDTFGFDFDTPATRNTVYADETRHPPGS